MNNHIKGGGGGGVLITEPIQRRTEKGRIYNTITRLWSAGHGFLFGSHLLQGINGHEQGKCSRGPFNWLVLSWHRQLFLRERTPAEELEFRGGTI